MADKMIPAVRLGSHEINELVEKNYREAKLKRLNQVRNQASQFAKDLRQEGRDKRKRELRKIEEEIKTKTSSELKSIIQDLENDALTCLTEFGSAHALADQENNADYDSARQADFSRNRQKALRLGKEALGELQLQKQEEHRQQTKALKSRQHALNIEAVRSSYIISLPPVNYIQNETSTKEEPVKVMLFDKSTLFQTEYVMKEKIVEVVPSPKDAREAAALSEIEDQQRFRDKERLKVVNDLKIQKRGHEALVKEKSHANYLRLLEELDKMENKNPGKEWDVESTAISEPSTSETADSEIVSQGSDVEETPVRDHPTFGRFSRPVVRPSSSLPSPPTLTGQDVEQLNEIGQLLKELREEQDRWTISDRAQILKTQTDSSSAAQSISSTENSALGNGSLVLYSDDDIRIRCGVSESIVSQRRKDFASALNAICKEREQLESALKQGKTVPSSSRPPGILRRPSHPSPPHQQPSSSATSTPLVESKREPIIKKSSQMDDDRKRVLKQYIQKLMDMKRGDISKLSVSSSSSSATTSTPKPTVGLLPPLSNSILTTTSSEGVIHLPGYEWSRSSGISSSAYDSPATEQSSSKISNTSSLPLGAEACAFRKLPDGDRLNSDGLFSLAPLLDVYNDIYQAYNQRMRAMAEESSLPVQQIPPWQQDTLTESSFMSLTLSGTSSKDRSSFRQRVPYPEQSNQSPFGFELTLSSSSSSSSQSSCFSSDASRPGSVQHDWAAAGKRTPKSSSTLSGSSTTPNTNCLYVNSSSTSSQDVSMPDVDEALRRLGLPSMQSVLRR